MESDEKQASVSKWLKVIYRSSDGSFEQTAEHLSVFDFWAIGRYLFINPIVSGWLEDDEKMLEVMWLEDGSGVKVYANKITPLDALSLSRYLELAGDEQYITVKNVERIKEANANPVEQKLRLASPSRSERRKLEREGKAN